MDCVFCKIVKGEIPAQKLYEDEHIISFLDVFPVGRGHSLVVPKVHCSNLQEAPPEILGHLTQAAQKVAKALVSGLRADAFNMFLNNGKVAGQIVPHLHFHILPRFADDGFKLGFQKIEYQDGEIDKIRTKVAAQITAPSRDQLLNALQQAAADKNINCAKALNIARQHQISSKELGAVLNELQIKLRNCQLGCF